MISLAETLGFQCEVDDVAASRITTTATAHLACAVPDRTFFGYAVGLAHLALREDVVRAGGITIDRGMVRVPSGPGLGIELDQDVVARAEAGARHLQAAAHG